VDVVDPDGSQDLVGFDGAWQAAEALVQEPHLVIDSRQDGVQGGAASSGFFPTIDRHRIEKVAKVSRPTKGGVAFFLLVELRSGAA